jgi:hypothetical protein
MKRMSKIRRFVEYLSKKLLPTSISETQMALPHVSFLTVVLVVAILLVAVYLLKPNFFASLFSTRSGFTGTMEEDSNSSQERTQDASGNDQVNANNGNTNVASFADVAGGNIQDLTAALTKVADAAGTLKQGFANIDDVTGPSEIDSAQGPAGCYPRDQLTPAELLPKDPNSTWAQQNPMGQGSLKGKNFLSAGALIGVNTVGQSLRNANLQLRSEPPNPQVPVSVFYNSTIQPDTSHRDLEIN